MPQTEICATPYYSQDNLFRPQIARRCMQNQICGNQRHPRDKEIANNLLHILQQLFYRFLQLLILSFCDAFRLVLDLKHRCRFIVF